MAYGIPQRFNLRLSSTVSLVRIQQQDPLAVLVTSVYDASTRTASDVIRDRASRTSFRSHVMWRCLPRFAASMMAAVVMGPGRQVTEKSERRSWMNRMGVQRMAVKPPLTIHSEERIKTLLNVDRFIADAVVKLKLAMQNI